MDSVNLNKKGRMWFLEAPIAMQGDSELKKTELEKVFKQNFDVFLTSLVF